MTSTQSALNYIRRQNTVSIFFPDEAPVSLTDSHPNFERICRVLTDHAATNEEKIVELKSLVSISAQLNDMKLRVRGGQVFCRGTPVPEGVSRYFTKVLKEGGVVEPVARFIFRMFDNPNRSSVEQLYEFISHNNMMITEDGHFLAYKKVRKNFHDVFTGKINNAPGQVVSMSRGHCDDRRDVTCSFGLHVASLEYARGFDSGVLVICKVDPKDVVAVPNDYNNQKMRVCRYEVIGIYNKNGQEDLFERTVITPEMMSSDALVGDTVKEGDVIAWSKNGIAQTGIVAKIVAENQSALELLEPLDGKPGRIRFKDVEKFHRVLVKNDKGGWNALALSFVEKKIAEAAKKKPKRKPCSDDGKIYVRDNAQWQENLAGKVHEFKGEVVAVIRRGSDAIRAVQVYLKGKRCPAKHVHIRSAINQDEVRALVKVMKDGVAHYYAPAIRKLKK